MYGTPDNFQISDASRGYATTCDSKNPERRNVRNA